MKRSLVGVGVLAAVFVQPANAADLDIQPAIQQIVLSGMVESWTGYTFHSGVGEGNLEDHFRGSRSGRLSIPLGNNLSIQMDAENEINSSRMFDDGDKYEDNFYYSFQGIGHLSARDPGTGLVGVFGGFGVAASETDDGNNYSYNVVGGEGQLYLNDFTLYGQGGYIDGSENPGALEDQFRNAAFGRGVVRWFTTENSRLQGEVSYASGDIEGEDVDVIEWGARYDTVLGLPIVGNTNVFVGYRGAHFENLDAGDEKFTDHAVMVGFRTWFGGNTLREFDRVGATLDTPNFGRWTASGL